MQIEELNKDAVGPVFGITVREFGIAQILCAYQDIILSDGTVTETGISSIPSFGGKVNAKEYIWQVFRKVTSRLDACPVGGMIRVHRAQRPQVHNYMNRTGTKFKTYLPDRHSPILCVLRIR